MIIHILVTILKILGIFLLVLLGLAAVLLLLILFCPVTYQAAIKKNQEQLSVAAKVGWLFHLISVSLSLQDGEFSKDIRLFGISLSRIQEILSGVRKKKAGVRKAKKSAPESPEKPKNSQPAKTETVSKSPEKGIKQEEKVKSENEQAKQAAAVEEDKKQNVSGTQREEKAVVRDEAHTSWPHITAFFKKLAAIPFKLRSGAGRIKKKAEALLLKAGNLKRFLEQEELWAALRLVLHYTGKTLRHILPKRIKGRLYFGFSDPALTGICLGGISMFYPLTKDTLTVEPDFHKKIFESDLDIKGRLYGVFALYVFLKVYFNKNVKYCIKRFKNKEA